VVKRIVLAGLMVLGYVRSAEAGRTFYGWLYGTEVMPERSAEIQTWVLEENGRDPGNVKTTGIWWSPLIGVTDQLELALPVEFTWARGDGGDADFTFSRWGIEARYRLVSQDPEDSPAFAPLVRLAVKRDVGVRDAVQPEADVVLSYETGRVHLLLDLGIVGQITRDDRRFEFRPGGGVSVEVIEDLRFGAEVYAQIDIDETDNSWAIVAPNIAWSHGRTWISAAMGIGIYHIDNAPRVMWGIAF
jgi:hypothetical protein